MDQTSAEVIESSTAEKKVEDFVNADFPEDAIDGSFKTCQACGQPSPVPELVKPKRHTQIQILKHTSSNRRDSDDDSPKDESEEKEAEAGVRPVYGAVEDDLEAKKTDVNDPTWQWPAYDEVKDRYGNIKYMKRSKAVLRDEGSPFQVIYRERSIPWPDRVQIKLNSSHLIKVLQDYLPNNKGLIDDKQVQSREIYTVVDALKRHKFGCADGNCTSFVSEIEPVKGNDSSEVSTNGFKQSQVAHENGTIEVPQPVMKSKDTTDDRRAKKADEGRLHLNHLLRFMAEEYKDVSVRNQRMKEEKSVSHDMLWAFLPPGKKVVYKCSYTQELLCAMVSSNEYVDTRMCGVVFSLKLDVWDYNGDVYRECQIHRNIGKFSGECPFNTLEVRPIEMEDRAAEDLEAEFIANGRKFEQLVMRSSNRFMQYRGPVIQMKPGDQELSLENADGRVMIDIRSFAKMNPGYPMRNAQPPLDYGSDDPGDLAFQGGSYRRCDKNGSSYRRDGSRWVLDDSSSSAEVVAWNISDENLLFAPAIVYGFSFTLKEWGSFAVAGFSEINFNTNSFDGLVMDEEMKGLVYSLVSQYIAIPDNNRVQPVVHRRVDPIPNKGEGCIFLCYGPPGTGKTLTAESIAEKMCRPLWALSVSELGTNPKDVEKALLEVLEIAALWRAVLLLDEADVYLEKRADSGDLTRNAMTGVFLRLLEYFRGVLFLTTNRITTFDDAFRSRISLFLYYPNLNADQREQIWKTSLARVHVNYVSAEFLAEIAQHDLNGREIRNLIQTAQTLAQSRNEIVHEHHLAFVIKMMINSKHKLTSITQK